LEKAVAVFAEKRAITYLDNKGEEVSIFTFHEFYDSVCRIASYLQREVGIQPGDRVVLLYPPGVEFIIAFYACLKAGVIAVPVYPPVSSSNYPFPCTCPTPISKLLYYHIQQKKAN